MKEGRHASHTHLSAYSRLLWSKVALERTRSTLYSVWLRRELSASVSSEPRQPATGTSFGKSQQRLRPDRRTAMLALVFAEASAADAALLDLRIQPQQGLVPPYVRLNAS